MTYTVITQHGVERTVRRRRFTDYDAAEAYAKTVTPDHDGSVVPNVDEKYGTHKEYQRGYFWNGNRYAVVLRKGANQYGPL